MQNKVSVIIPSYNYCEYIEECLNSVLSQSYPNTQVIVVDDGSTDGTSDILEKYRKWVEVLHQENAGPAAAKNAGIKLASGEFICFLDADDIFLPDKIHMQLDLMQDNSSVGLVHTGVNWINENGEIFKVDFKTSIHDKEEQIFQLLIANYITSSSVMIRRDVFRDVGLFNEKLKYAEDYEMWLRIIRNFRIEVISQPLICYRWHGRNLTLSTKNRELVRTIKETAAQYFFENKQLSEKHLRLLNRIYQSQYR